MTDENKISLESIKIRSEQRALANNPSTIASYEESKNIVSSAVRKSFFLIQAKLEAAKALWSGGSDLTPENDQVLLLLSEVIDHSKLFSDYKCNPFAPHMMLKSREERTSIWLLQAAFEKDKSKLVTPNPPLDAYENIRLEVRSIRSLIWSFAEDEDGADVASLLSNLISHIERSQTTIESLWKEHFPERCENS